MIEKKTMGEVPAGSIPQNTAPYNSETMDCGSVGTTEIKQVTPPESGAYQNPSSYNSQGTYKLN